MEFKNWLENQKEIEVLQTYLECESLYESTVKSNEIEGDLVEVGVYTGGSAKIINEYKSKDKKLYLFDTFKGLMDCDPEKDSLKNEEINPPKKIDFITEIFKNDNVSVIEGYFPESAPEEFEFKKFSLIHLDVDTYKSTINSLNYFYEKISKGGYIIVHDYRNKFNHTKGVEIAVDEFLEEKKEKIFKIVDSQCIIIKS